MKRTFTWLIGFAALFMAGPGNVMISFAQSSVLKSGPWFKVAVEKNGVYKIDHALFKKMGFNPSNIDPRKIKIYGNEGGMLPQPNSTARPSDLTENAIYVQGEADGVFNSSDYILFYAQGADKISFDAGREIFAFEKNLYADKNFYFITVSESNGKRISTSSAIPGTFPAIDQFENFSYYELDEHSELKSGRAWFGEMFDAVTTFTKNVSFDDVVPGSSIKFVSSVMAQSFSGSSFTVSLNGVEILEQNVPSIPNTQYGVKGRDRRDTIQVNEATVSASSRSSQEINYQYTKSPSGKSIGYLDYFLIQVTQKLVMNGSQTTFRSLASLENPVSNFQIEQSSSQTIVWDVTDPYEPVQQTSVFSSGKTSFAAVSSVLKEYVAFSSGSAPELVGSVSNQDLHGMAAPDFLIVTYPDFRSEALRLAEHRGATNGLSVAVVTTQEVYNEFSSGRQDVAAIRDLAKWFYDKHPGTLRSLLLFGKGSYDYKKRVVDNINYVPTYESRNSLHPLLTYSSDDYFAFLEDSEGEWGEDPAEDHTMDIAAGRIPVKSVSEAKDVVDKIIGYDTDKTLLGKWRKEIVFVADDGDSNLHQDDANDLAEDIEANHAEFHVKKIYLDKYVQESRPSGEISEETSKLIEDSFNNGALVINYTGHGGERVWAQEKIFDDLMIARLENKRLPLLVTATCEFGRQDDPVFISGAELCMLRPESGAIGLVSTSRPVNAATNFLLNKAFYNAFFQKENNQYLSLGEIFRRTKNDSESGVANRNFSLIGDPSLHLVMPQFNAEVTQISTASGSVTLKALSSVTVTGRITDHTNNLVPGFNGVLEVTLFDKKTSFITLGDENQPYPYDQWYNALFRGKATVQNGEFEFNFIMPKNIAYQVDEGKLSLYAYDTLHKTEASGYSQDLEIGLSETDVEADLTAPSLRLFMGDTTFVNGGLTNPNTVLVARLYDEHGINISGYGIGNSIIGALDDSETFILNDFYESDIDDFTRGTISFPISNIPPGKHTITVKAWDTYNNPVQSTVDFIVTDGTRLIIEEFGNYPNPFATNTTLFFTHNRAGDDLQASLALYDNTGLLLQSYDFDIPASNYQVDLLEINSHAGFLKNRSGGLYFARLIVRSVTNGSKNEQVTKLILLN